MATTDVKSEQPAATEKSPALLPNDEAFESGVALNVSGHKQELQRNFGLLSLCGLAITTGNVWPALGGAIVRAGSVSKLLSLTKLPNRMSQSTMAVLLASSTSSSPCPSSTGSLLPRSPNYPRPFLQQAEV